MNTFKLEKGSKFFDQVNEIFEVNKRWEEAVKDIGEMLGVPDLDEVAVMAKRLAITWEEVNKIENGVKLFKSEKGFYTPKLNTKKGKEWAAGFEEIAIQHKLDVPNLGTLMFMYGMHNYAFSQDYRGTQVFRLDGDIYMSWKGDGEPRAHGIERIESREYYDALAKFEEKGSERA